MITTTSLKHHKVHKTACLFVLELLLISSADFLGYVRFHFSFTFPFILRDPGADSGGERKSKRAGKKGTKKSCKEQREEPLATMSYQTSSKRSPPFCLLTGQKNTKVFWHQSKARTTATVWNWSGKTLSPGALLAVLFFSSCHIFKLLALKSTGAI